MRGAENRLDGSTTGAENRLDGYTTDVENRLDGSTTDVENRLDGSTAPAVPVGETGESVLDAILVEFLFKAALSWCDGLSSANTLDVVLTAAC